MIQHYVSRSVNGQTLVSKPPPISGLTVSHCLIKEELKLQDKLCNLPIPEGEREPGLFLFDLHIVVQKPFRHEGFRLVPVILTPHHVQEAGVEDHICVE